MKNTASIGIITKEVSARVQSALGSKLCKIIMYGSYARGDYNAESDVDVMVLADVGNDEELWEMEKSVWNIGWEIGTDHNIMISIFLKDVRHFDEWIDAMAYYRNIVEDGVLLYG